MDICFEVLSFSQLIVLAFSHFRNYLYLLQSIVYLLVNLRVSSISYSLICNSLVTNPTSEVCTYHDLESQES